MRTPPSSGSVERWAFEELEKLEKALADALLVIQQQNERIVVLEEKVAQSAS